MYDLHMKQIKRLAFLYITGTSFLFGLIMFDNVGDEVPLNLNKRVPPVMVQPFEEEGCARWMTVEVVLKDRSLMDPKFAAKVARCESE